MFKIDNKQNQSGIMVEVISYDFFFDVYCIRSMLGFAKHRSITRIYEYCAFLKRYK